MILFEVFVRVGIWRDDRTFGEDCFVYLGHFVGDGDGLGVVDLSVYICIYLCAYICGN